MAGEPMGLSRAQGTPGARWGGDPGLVLVGMEGPLTGSVRGEGGCTIGHGAFGRVPSRTVNRPYTSGLVAAAFGDLREDLPDSLEMVTGVSTRGRPGSKRGGDGDDDDAREA